MKKISVLIGTRPEAIKMAPVILEARNYDNITIELCSTGQHTSMLTGALKAFGLEPNFKLDVMRPGQSLGSLTALLLDQVTEYLSKSKPDLVLVHGDTTSAMIGALAAFYATIPVGHVEAGLRTGNVLSPFPEEFNRKSISLTAKYHFAPSNGAAKALKNEGVNSKHIHVTGNTVIDALLETVSKFTDESKVSLNMRNHFTQILGFSPENINFILITAHRRENWDEGIIKICNAIKRLALLNSDFKFIYPVHLNPNIRKVVHRELFSINNVFLIPPQDYEEFSWLLLHSYFLLTDSGGIQEEAPALGKPVLVMRDSSERPEAISYGTAMLVGSDPKKIIESCQLLINDSTLYNKMASATNPYGNGTASKQILKVLKDEDRY